MTELDRQHSQICQGEALRLLRETLTQRSSRRDTFNLCMGVLEILKIKILFLRLAWKTKVNCLNSLADKWHPFGYWPNICIAVFL